MRSRGSLTRALCTGVIAVVLLGACSVADQGASPEGVAPEEVAPLPSESTTSPEPAEPIVQRTELVTVGDIACDPASPVFDDPQYCRHEEVARLTSRLVNQGADWFVPLGDIQYESGTLEAFETVYDRWFGKFRSITMPIPGNHERYTEGAAGYFAYFGKRAGTSEQPWSHFSPVKGWRVFLLDSNCAFIDASTDKAVDAGTPDLHERSVQAVASTGTDGPEVSSPAPEGPGSNSNDSGFAKASWLRTSRPWTTSATASSASLLLRVRGRSSTATILAGTCRGEQFSRSVRLIVATSSSSSEAPSASRTKSTMRVSSSHAWPIASASSTSGSRSTCR